MSGFGHHLAGPGAARSRRRGGRPAAAIAVVVAVVVGFVVASIVVAIFGPGLAAARADTVVVIDGRGFGHGVGMAQDGAYWMGKSGRTASDILKLFYPGTTLVKKSGTVRVPLLSVGSLTIGFPNGGSIGGRSVAAGGSISVRTASGGLVATSGGSSDASSTAGGRTTSAPALGQSVALRSTAGSTAGTEEVTMRLISARSVVRAQSVATPSVAADTTPPGPVLTAPTTPTPTTAPIPSTLPVPLDPSGPGAIILIATTTIPPVPPSVAASSVEPGATTSVATATVAPSPGSAVPETAEPTVADTAPTDTTVGPATTEPAVAVPVLRATTKGGLLTIGAKRYRGTLELTASSGIRVVNDLDIEDYLRGMGEILSPTWPAATLQAQAIAARTYAFRTMATAGEVCPTQRCQVYLGAQAEYAQMDAAVAATRGKVLSYNGRLAATFYSASGGGTIASPTEAFGGNGTDLPYLKAGVYPTGDVKAWTVRMSMAEVGRRLGYPGALRSVTVSAVGPSGRATEVTLDGSGGTTHLGGPKVDAALGLRSTFFTVRTEFGTVADTSTEGGDTTTDTGSGTGAVDLSAQTGLLAASDPVIGADESTSADQTLDGTEPTVDTSVIADPSDSNDWLDSSSTDSTALAALSADPAARASQAALAAGIESAPGEAHRDSSFDVVVGTIVAAVVLAGIAIVRKKRRSGPT